MGSSNYLHNHQCKISPINRNILKLRFGLDAQHLFEGEDSIQRFLDTQTSASLRWWANIFIVYYCYDLFYIGTIILHSHKPRNWMHSINAPPLQGPQATFRRTGRGIRTRTRSSPFVEPKVRKGGYCFYRIKLDWWPFSKLRTMWRPIHLMVMCSSGTLSFWTRDVAHPFFGEDDSIGRRQWHAAWAWRYDWCRSWWWWWWYWWWW